MNNYTLSNVTTVSHLYMCIRTYMRTYIRMFIYVFTNECTVVCIKLK